MATQIETAEREIVLVEDPRVRPIMGLSVLETLPSARIPYSLVDPFILVHEGVVPSDFGASADTRHPHRGFDNLWYRRLGRHECGDMRGVLFWVNLARKDKADAPSVYMLEGEASLGANRRRASRSQIAVLGAGRALSVADAQPGTRFMLMAGKPYGETPVYNGPYVD